MARTVYGRHGCSVCHGTDGKGGFANPNAQTDSKVRGVTTSLRNSPRGDQKVIWPGSRDRPQRRKRSQAAVSMPGWAGQMTDQQVGDVAIT